MGIGCLLRQRVILRRRGRGHGTLVSHSTDVGCISEEINMIPTLFIVLILWGYIYQPLKERPRDILSVCLGLTMIAITSLALREVLL
jgi:hypothetical protein